MAKKDDVHPRWKKPVGYRLSQAALSLSYNKPGLFLGPRLRKAEFHGPSVTLTFSHAGSSIRGTQGPLVHGFTVAGSDRMFFPARAEIIGPSTVSVKIESISEVIAVRYGWNDFPASELTDSDGNPAISFRVFR
ncbi:MAG: hypothetical protein LR011_11805 [Verrucomicrobia bacterium]|nr:hypothetical protein [Verrucomicrobiota bacterium]